MFEDFYFDIIIDITNQMELISICSVGYKNQNEIEKPIKPSV